MWSTLWWLGVLATSRKTRRNLSTKLRRRLSMRKPSLVLRTVVWRHWSISTLRTYHCSWSDCTQFSSCSTSPCHNYLRLTRLYWIQSTSFFWQSLPLKSFWRHLHPPEPSWLSMGSTCSMQQLCWSLGDSWCKVLHSRAWVYSDWLESWSLLTGTSLERKVVWDTLSKTTQLIQWSQFWSSFKTYRYRTR